MKIALISDIHSNSQALEAVIQDIRQFYPDVEAYWFLGDLIGYCGNPVESYQTLKSLLNRDETNYFWLGGNHEEIKLDDVYKRDTLRIGSSDAIDKKQVLELAGSGIDVKFIIWREKIVRKDLDGIAYFLTHSSYSTPDNYHKYLFGWVEDNVYEKLFLDEYRKLPDYTLSRCMLFGHTHIPTLVRAKIGLSGIGFDPVEITPFQTYTIEPDYTWFINPGSVGIPNDLDPRAAYAVLNTGANHAQITFNRVEYDVDAAAHALEKKNYGARYTAGIVDRLHNAICDPETPEKWRLHYEKVKGIKRP